MSSTSPSTPSNTDNSSSKVRVNYSNYVADITSSPKTARKLATTGIGHHINPLHNPYPNKPNQPAQQSSGMPQYGGGVEKCARCSKSVYLAEKRVGAGRSFHISCFSCHTCKRKLDASTLSEHKGEIYCKPCYTKQFGAHGLISGVSMSTEMPVTRDSRYTRHSSYSSDLDDPVVTEQKPRQRINSTDGILRERYSGTQNNDFSQKYPRQNDVIPELNSPLNKKNNGINAIVDQKYQRSPSPIGFESNTNDNRHRSTYIGEEDRSKYIHKGAQLSYGSGTSAIVDIPIVSHPKRSNSTNDQTEMSFNPIRETQRSRSPSITSNDPYRRQNSRDRQSDLADDYSRMNMNEFNTNRNSQQYSTNNPVSAIASDNPLATRNFYHSSSTSSFENNYKNTASTSNPYDREQYHSRESSPSVTGNRNRSPTPLGYISSSSTTRTSSSTYRAGSLHDATSSYTPQHENVNIRTSPNLYNRGSSSPQRNDYTSYGIDDFVRKTNIAENVSPSGGNNFSALNAFVNKPRQQYNDFDD